ncbi:MAG: hypothetical protein L0Y71_05465 [Gemmataceae bacterium]|nr:hypothetical protein [Gemmataceae bacterium]
MRSTMRPVRRGVLLASALGFFVLCGCGGPALPPMVPVEGSVTVDGAPVTSGQVSFVPVSAEPDKPVPPSNGQIDASGSYRIFTGGKAGAPAGKYKVTVTPSMVPMQGATSMPKTPFNERFRDLNKTTLQIEVAADKAAGAYDLKLTK